MTRTIRGALEREPEERPTRGCDVCSSAERRIIWTQHFLTFDDGTGLAGYVVVACDVCGFLYADGLPALSVFERYYRELSKYDPQSDDKPIPSYKQHNYNLIASELAKRLPNRNARILDVGSASGDLLSILREYGYTNLTGIDPSPRCAETAQRRHGLRVLNTPISQMHSAPERFDLILLAGVLEHLRDLRESLVTLKRLLSEGGAIGIAVPNAARFADFTESPFQHLSAEHINFFTLESLASLLGTVGMRLAGSWETTHLVGIMQEPTVNAIFESGEHKQIRKRRVPDDACMERYVAQSQALQNNLASKISTLAASGEDVIIWGAGSLTMHLLSDPAFSPLNIVAFVDANKNYWGKFLRGVPVCSPSRLKNYLGTILVVSYAYESEICSQIRSTYNSRNRVVPLFEHAPRNGTPPCA